MAEKVQESKIWLASPTMHGEELKYMVEAYETNWMSTVGANINEVERIAAEKADLLLALAAIMDRGERMAPPRQEAFQAIVGHEPYSVSDKAGEILRRLKQSGITRFLLLFRGSRSRSEIVATFLAVLELCRASVIRLAGGETDCTVDSAADAPDDFTI